MVRILVAPQEFKGTLTASAAARALAEGVRATLQDAEIVEAPMSDGGAGLVEALLAARGGRRIESDAHDPLMRPLRADWALLADGTAVIEMAAASGLVLLRPDERAPLAATTYGTGELIASALTHGSRHILVGVGGSATVDAGAGAMQALAARLVDDRGAELARGGAALARLDRIDLSQRDARLEGATVDVLCDVTNTLCGPDGAAAVFGPQKGASADDVRQLNAALLRFAEVARRDCGVDVLTLPGGGAAGGLAAGLAVLGATVRPGFAAVAEATNLVAQIARSNAVITGEGKLDRQTAFGKTVAGVAALARAHGAFVVAVAGSIADDYDGGALDAVLSLSEIAGSAAAAQRNAASTLRLAGAEAARIIAARLEARGDRRESE